MVVCGVKAQVWVRESARYAEGLYFLGSSIPDNAGVFVV